MIIVITAVIDESAFKGYSAWPAQNLRKQPI